MKQVWITNGGRQCSSVEQCQRVEALEAMLADKLWRERRYGDLWNGLTIEHRDSLLFLIAEIAP